MSFLGLLPPELFLKLFIEAIVERRRSAGKAAFFNLRGACDGRFLSEVLESEATSKNNPCLDL